MREINLRPYREKEEKEIKKSFKISIIVSLIVSTAFIGYQYNEYSKTLNNYEERVGIIEEKLNYINNFNEANKDIENKKRLNLEKLEVSYSLYNGKLNTAKMLDELVTVFPSNNGKINKLVKNKNTITINGTLSTEDNFYSFLDNMKKSKTLSAYTINEINKTKDNIQFEVQVFESIN